MLEYRDRACWHLLRRGPSKKKKKERKRQRSRKKFKLGSLSLSMQAFGTRDNLGEDFY